MEDVRITVAASCVAVNGYGAQPLYAPGAQLWPPETDIDGNSQGSMAFSSAEGDERRASRLLQLTPSRDQKIFRLPDQ